MDWWNNPIVGMQIGVGVILLFFAAGVLLTRRKEKGGSELDELPPLASCQKDCPIAKRTPAQD